MTGDEGASDKQQEVGSLPVVQAVHEAPVILADGAVGLIADDHLVKFNLYQDRIVIGSSASLDQPVERVICARLVMSRSVFAQLAEWLIGAADKIPASNIAAKEE